MFFKNLVRDVKSFHKHAKNVCDKNSGEIASQIIMIGIFALAAIVVGGVLYNAFVAQGNRISNCLENSSTVVSTNTTGSTNSCG